MDRLQVSTDVLREASWHLRQVTHEFKEANHNADEFADAVGHPGLAGAVRSLAHSWDGHRARMLHGVKELADATKGIAESFELVDLELGKLLRDEL